MSLLLVGLFLGAAFGFTVGALCMGIAATSRDEDEWAP